MKLKDYNLKQEEAFVIFKNSKHNVFAFYHMGEYSKDNLFECDLIVTPQSSNYYSSVECQYNVSGDEEIIPVDIAFEWEGSQIKCVYSKEDNTVLWKDGKWVDD